MLKAVVEIRSSGVHGNRRAGMLPDVFFRTLSWWCVSIVSKSAVSRRMFVWPRRLNFSAGELGRVADYVPRLRAPVAGHAGSTQHPARRTTRLQRHEALSALPSRHLRR